MTSSVLIRWIIGKPMKQQKKIALINDITGFGRCSVTAMLPVISAMKIQACPLPTAILSVHTGFPEHYIDDYTARMRPYMENWQANRLTFDGICTGFFGAAEQVDIAIDFIKSFRREGTLVMVDPVMGDHGRLYSSITKDICREMKKLLTYADVVTPNLTEACELLDLPYPKGGKLDKAALFSMAEGIAALGARYVVITGMDDGADVLNYIYDGGKTKIFRARKIGGDRSGTGDVFAAIVAAGLVKGMGLYAAVVKAAAFIEKTLLFAEELELPWNYGLPIEEHLAELGKDT